MATVYREIDISGAQPVPGATMPQLKLAGSNFNADTYSFDAATDEALGVSILIRNYGSGNLTFKLRWYADTATTGDTIWDVSIAAITPADAQSVETKAFATANVSSASTASGTAHGMVEVTVTVSNLDSLANGDSVWVRIRRLGTNGSDNMSGDGQLLMKVGLEYSDT